MWRSRSDIGRIKYRDVHLRYEEETYRLEGVTIHIREPKESQQKFTKLGLLQVKEQEEVCVVRVLELFLQTTNERRKFLPLNHGLFLTYLKDNPKQEESKGAQPSTVGH